MPKFENTNVSIDVTCVKSASTNSVLPLVDADRMIILSLPSPPLITSSDVISVAFIPIISFPAPLETVDLPLPRVIESSPDPAFVVKSIVNEDKSIVEAPVKAEPSNSTIPPCFA